MKILHIGSSGSIYNEYIRFINENFEKNNHNFLIIDGEKKIEERSYKNNNIERYISKGRNFKGILKAVLLIFQIPILYTKLFFSFKKSDKIIIHGLFDIRIIVFLYMFKNFLKKSNWVIWGGDLYRPPVKKGTFLDKIDKYVKKNIAYVSSLVPEDYQMAKKINLVTGKYSRAIYMNPITLSFLEELEKDRNMKRESINIQIGNSSDPSNNHIEIIELLKKYKDKNIKIYCPLSYGNKEYAQEVQRYGKDIFKEKFIGLLDFLPPQEYARYINNIDILVFNHKRQQGLGNINALAYLERKIYVRSDISSWMYLKEELGLEIHDTLNIEKETFEDFISNPKNNNKERILSTVYSIKYMKNIWENNFNLL
ncbi:TDP-N-acetylfucosamine:lipid II N-acetylfucosaminyltransferase [Fusobacterium pseudoperiodonticum]|jgi:4-alpha-L-fucosyltransferase (fuc4NAc transferase)